ILRYVLLLTLLPTTYSPHLPRLFFYFFFFFFNDTATTEISPLSLHDALPISYRPSRPVRAANSSRATRRGEPARPSGVRRPRRSAEVPGPTERPSASRCPQVARCRRCTHRHRPVRPDPESQSLFTTSWRSVP